MKHEYHPKKSGNPIKAFSAILILSLAITSSATVAAPLSVGSTAVAAPLSSLGNRAWFDTNNNALLDSGETGLNGVVVELFLDTGAGIDPSSDTPYLVTTTSNDLTSGDAGYYLFDDLSDGDYIVRIAPSNFGPGGVLVDGLGSPFSSSESGGATEATYLLDNQQDNNDNGIDENLPQNNGIVSNVIQLTGATEPDGDMTIDFGLYAPAMSIGNRIWFDSNHNGLLDTPGDDNPAAPGNPGIGGVTVLLYRASNDGKPVGQPIARDISSSSGYYLFDVLDTDAASATDDGDGLGGIIFPGNYVVVLPPENFDSGGALEFHVPTRFNIDNSTGVEAVYPASGDDGNSDGTASASYGVISPQVSLMASNERADESTGLEPGIGDGGNNIQPSNSDLTIDFGFYIPMSIGNLVWVDTNNNGLYESAIESPVVDGTLLSLYQADGTTPVDDPANPGTPYQTVTSNGYYLFEGLTQGNYVVRVDLLNFLPAGLLAGYLSSDALGSGFQDNSDTDSNDNGFDDTPTTVGIKSGVIALSYSAQPVSEAVSGNPADGPDGYGNLGEQDINSNLTIDFGVFLPPTGNAVLSIAKTPDNGTITANDDAEFTITVENTGSQAAINATLSDQLPAPAATPWIVSEQPDGGACSVDGNNLLTCNFGDIGVGVVKTLKVKTTTSNDQCGNYENIAARAAADNASPVIDGGEINCQVTATTPPHAIPSGSTAFWAMTGVLLGLLAMVELRRRRV